MKSGTIALGPNDSVTAVSANDRLKAASAQWFWGSLLAASAIHFAALAFWPAMTTADLSIVSSEIEQIEVMERFEIPPPPEQIPRPAVPILSTDINISDELTIGEVRFEDNPVSELPAPPSGSGVNLADQPSFTPHDVRPTVRNLPEFTQALERRYPPMLRDAGIGGQTLLWVHIDEQGRVLTARVEVSSGYPQLDAVALAVMGEIARFTPALNRGQAVPVWIQIPVTFTARR